MDSSTAAVYLEKGLGSPRKDSFQTRCSKALKAKGTIGEVSEELIGLGWAREDAQKLASNLQGALNHGANVMQGLTVRNERRAWFEAGHASARVRLAQVGGVDRTDALRKNVRCALMSARRHLAAGRL